MAAVSPAQPLIGPLSFLGGAAEPVWIVLVTVVLTFFTLVIGELAPKRIAMQWAESWALLVARPLDVQPVIRDPDGSMLLPGTFPIHDLPDIGVDATNLSDSDYTTVAGLVLARLGHIPTTPGEVVTIDGHSAEVVEITGRAITRIRPRPQPSEQGAEPAGETLGVGQVGEGAFRSRA